jgi:2-polyprenyl-3-methyl-5-hydroxy-6-metoxy-1,4-benzoquinol methylase
LSLNPLEAVFITAFPVLAVIVPVQTVAGLGTFEGILTAGLYIVGIEGPQALVASMLLHVQLLLSSFVFFGAAYWFWSRRDKQRRIETHSEFYQALSLPEEDFRNVNLAELLLESAVGHTILDVGCGRGLLLSSAQKKGFEAVGIEPDASIRKLALRQYPNLKIANENVEDFKIEKQFDTVITADVLQCIKDYHRALLSIASFVKPGGRLIVAVPAVPGLFGERDKMMGYLRRYNMKSLSSDINTLGFRIVNTRYWNIASVIPYYVLYKLLRSRTHTMRIRGGNKNGIIATLFSRFLFTWFKRIENRFNFGFGLTAIIIADKVNPSSDF